jgi:hypothetical protein
MKDLNFVLPYFMHYCWTGEIVRSFYESRIFNLLRALQKIKINSVVNGSTQCRLIQINDGQVNNIKENIPNNLRIMPVKSRSIFCATH